MLSLRFSLMLSSLVLGGLGGPVSFAGASEAAAVRSGAAGVGQDSRPAGSTLELELVASDGQRVPGWFDELRPAGVAADDVSWRAEADVVVLLHMYGSEHGAWAPILGEFAARGISTLAIDMRGHGVNTKGPEGEDLAKRVEERDGALFRSMYLDAFAAVDWLQAQGFERGHIGVLGASVGCSVAIDAARRRAGLGPVGVLTPGLNYLDVPTEEHIKEWGTRDLLIVTSEEESGYGPAPLRDALGAALVERRKADPEAADHLTYWQLDQKGIHGTRMFGKVKGIEGRVAGWFAERFADRHAAEEAEERGPSSRPAAR